jgi:hypothetical protein
MDQSPGKGRHASIEMRLKQLQPKSCHQQTNRSTAMPHTEYLQGVLIGFLTHKTRQPVQGEKIRPAASIGPSSRVETHAGAEGRIFV